MFLHVWHVKNKFPVQDSGIATDYHRIVIGISDRRSVVTLGPSQILIFGQEASWKIIGHGKWPFSLRKGLQVATSGG
jgi:hypothetical protein